MAVFQELTTTLKLNAGDYNRKMKDAARQTGNFGRSIERIEKKLVNLGAAGELASAAAKAMGTGFTEMATGLELASENADDFNRSVKNINRNLARTGEISTEASEGMYVVADGMDEIGDQANQAGAATQFLKTELQRTNAALNANAAASRNAAGASKSRATTTAAQAAAIAEADRIPTGGKYLQRKVAEEAGLNKSLSTRLVALEKHSTAIKRAENIMLGATAVFAVFGGVALKSAIDFESAFAGVRKTVEATEPQFAALRESLLDMSTTLPATAIEIAGVAEVAGQLGIPQQAIASFTKTMIDLGESTVLNAQESAESLARFVNVMGNTQDEFENIGSTIVDLGNNFATTEDQILNMSQRVSGAAKSVGLTSQDVLALSTALSSVGVAAERGGTAFSRIIFEINSSVEEAGYRLQGFAELAGTTAQEFAETWRTAPAEGIRQVVEGVGRLAAEGGNVSATLDNLKLSGVRVQQSLLSLGGAGQLTANALRTANKAFEENTALATESERRYATAESEIRAFGNTVKKQLIDQGTQALPQLLSIIERHAESLPGLFATLADSGIQIIDALANGIPILESFARLLSAIPADLLVFGSTFALFSKILRGVAPVYVLLRSALAQQIALTRVETKVKQEGIATSIARARALEAEAAALLKAAGASGSKANADLTGAGAATAGTAGAFKGLTAAAYGALAAVVAVTAGISKGMGDANKQVQVTTSAVDALGLQFRESLAAGEGELVKPFELNLAEEQYRFGPKPLEDQGVIDILGFQIPKFVNDLRQGVGGDYQISQELIDYVGLTQEEFVDAVLEGGLRSTEVRELIATQPNAGGYVVEAARAYDKLSSEIRVQQAEAVNSLVDETLGLSQTALDQIQRTNTPGGVVTPWTQTDWGQVADDIRQVNIEGQKLGEVAANLGLPEEIGNFVASVTIDTDTGTTDPEEALGFIRELEREANDLDLSGLSEGQIEVAFAAAAISQETERTANLVRTLNLLRIFPDLSGAEQVSLIANQAAVSTDDLAAANRVAADALDNTDGAALNAGTSVGVLKREYTDAAENTNEFAHASELVRNALEASLGTFNEFGYTAESVQFALGALEDVSADAGEALAATLPEAEKHRLSMSLLAEEYDDVAVAARQLGLSEQQLGDIQAYLTEKVLETKNAYNEIFSTGGASALSGLESALTEEYADAKKTWDDGQQQLQRAAQQAVNSVGAVDTSAIGDAAADAVDQTVIKIEDAWATGRAQFKNGVWSLDGRPIVSAPTEDFGTKGPAGTGTTFEETDYQVQVDFLARKQETARADAIDKARADIARERAPARQEFVAEEFPETEEAFIEQRLTLDAITRQQAEDQISKADFTKDIGEILRRKQDNLAGYLIDLGAEDFDVASRLAGDLADADAEFSAQYESLIEEMEVGELGLQQILETQAAAIASVDNATLGRIQGKHGEVSQYLIDLWGEDVAPEIIAALQEIDEAVETPADFTPKRRAAESVFAGVNTTKQQFLEALQVDPDALDEDAIRALFELDGFEFDTSEGQRLWEEILSLPDDELYAMIQRTLARLDVITREEADWNIIASVPTDNLQTIEATIDTLTRNRSLIIRPELEDLSLRPRERELRESFARAQTDEEQLVTIAKIDESQLDLALVEDILQLANYSQGTIDIILEGDGEQIASALEGAFSRIDTLDEQFAAVVTEMGIDPADVPDVLDAVQNLIDENEPPVVIEPEVVPPTQLDEPVLTRNYSVIPKTPSFEETVFGPEPESGLPNLAKNSADKFKEALEEAGLNEQEFRVAIQSDVRGLDPDLIREVLSLGGYDDTEVEFLITQDDDTLETALGVVVDRISGVLGPYPAVITADPDEASFTGALNDLQGVINGQPLFAPINFKAATESQALLRLWADNSADSDTRRLANIAYQSSTSSQADGGVLDFYANGGIATKEQHIAHIAPAGTWRVFAEDETGGEAYIPLSPNKRARSLAIVGEVLRRFGLDDFDEWKKVFSRPFGPKVEKYATGGINGRQVSRWPSVQRYATGGITTTRPIRPAAWVTTSNSTHTNTTTINQQPQFLGDMVMTDPRAAVEYAQRQNRKNSLIGVA